MRRFRFDLLVWAALLLVSACAMQTRAPKPTPSLTTVVEAKKLPNDSRVMLEGYVLQPTGDRRYIFKDDTGAIAVEINDVQWDYVRVGPRTKVRLIGDVKGAYGSASLDIEVREISVIQEGQPVPPY